jgi:hypothetical protein
VECRIESGSARLDRGERLSYDRADAVAESPVTL